MMAAKLEWVHSICPHSGDQWTAGKWSIFLWEDGRFIVQSDGADCDSPLCYQLAEAKAYCQTREEAASPAELPVVGSVWGVPGKEAERIVVTDVSLRGGYWGITYRGPCGPKYILDIAWQSWVRESGAVRIDGGVKELEAEVTHWRTATERLERGSERLARELAAAEGEVARLREQNQEFKRLGQQFERDARDHSSQSCINKERYEKAEQKRDDLRARNDILERRFADYRDCLDIAGAIATSVKCYDSDYLVEAISPHIEPLIAERDAERAANARMLEALREAIRVMEQAKERGER